MRKLDIDPAIAGLVFRLATFCGSRLFKRSPKKGSGNLMHKSKMETAPGDADAANQSPEAESVAQSAGTGFASLGLSDALLTAVESLGYMAPTPIQAQTIPLLLEGRDLLGQAQTGTGKTAAFALPLLQRIDLSKKQPQVLVLAPTRELAIPSRRGVREIRQRYARIGRGPDLRWTRLPECSFDNLIEAHRLLSVHPVV